MPEEFRCRYFSITREPIAPASARFTVLRAEAEREISPGKVVSQKRTEVDLVGGGGPSKKGIKVGATPSRTQKDTL